MGIYIEIWSYNFAQLSDDFIKDYLSKNNPDFSIWYVDKFTSNRLYIQLDSEEKFIAIHENEKEVTIYVTTENNLDSNNLNVSNQLCYEDDLDYCPSGASYYSRLSSDNEYEPIMDDDVADSFSKNNLSMKVGSKYENVISFKRALNHYAIMNEFEYFIQKSDLTRFTGKCEKIDCVLRIHASIMHDGITFEIKKMVEGHTCTRSNKGGNKHATQGWVANIITDKLKSDIRMSLLWSIEIFRGKEQAYTDMYGKWKESFMKLDEFREDLLNRNEGSIMEIDFDINGDKKCKSPNLLVYQSDPFDSAES
uniref:Transposase MuDR plant domain-containing protein n=1 Tax=Lactuca sativa TaxID=4236 RepID=A0A9R1W5Z9_LACSA|nr:hypothetical protein LSAT_V11C300154870 [Lactuca sativa]